jgi:hypothetical protein
MLGQKVSPTAIAKLDNPRSSIYDIREEYAGGTGCGQEYRNLAAKPSTELFSDYLTLSRVNARSNVNA